VTDTARGGRDSGSGTTTSVAAFSVAGLRRAALPVAAPGDLLPEHGEIKKIHTVWNQWSDAVFSSHCAPGRLTFSYF